jgi:hypothetical protein
VIWKLFCPLILLLGAGPLLAQSAPPATNPPSQNRPMRRGGQEPCWQQAGIEKSVMEQVWTIGRDARSQVEAVCSNSSLTPQERHRQAREIREMAMQKREGLMTADQKKTLMACQQQRNRNHPGSGAEHEGAWGGCGEMPRAGSRPGGSANQTPGNGTSNPPQSN